MNESIDISPWLDVAGVAAYLKTTPDGIRGLVKRERIPVHKVPGSGRLLFHRDEIDAWILGKAA